MFLHFWRETKQWSCESERRSKVNQAEYLACKAKNCVITHLSDIRRMNNTQ